MGYESMHARLVEQLQDVRSAERRLTQALQALARGVTALRERSTVSSYGFGAFESTGETLNLLGLEEVTRMFEESLDTGVRAVRARPPSPRLDVDPQWLLECGGALG